MNRLALERRQVWVYVAAVVAGLAVGAALPAVAPLFERLLWPVLALLLYATFVQVPLLHLREALHDHRFVAAVLLGNFVLVPAFVWLLLAWLPADPALRLGVLLVLLVPCTDWFITFTQLGGGDTPRAIAVTPLNLLLQLLLLPLYAWLMLGEALVPALDPARAFAPAAALIALPLAAAAATERWIEARRERARWRERLAWAPVPLLALVVFLIAGAQVDAVRTRGSTVVAALPVFVAYLIGAAFAARALAAALALPPAAGRTLAFSLGTRNSFLVLPFALALPAGWEAAVVTIVLQSLVELAGMLVYLSWIPQRLFPNPHTRDSQRRPPRSNGQRRNE
ncbi:MAG: arsenic resistance protein [Burkholderiaceae bacterium]